MAFVWPDWTALAPAIVLAVTALLLLVVDSVYPHTTDRPLLSGISTLGAVVAGGLALWFIGSGTGDNPIHLYGNAMVVDTMSLFFVVIFTSVTALVSIASYDYLQDNPYQAEYYTLVVLAATGMTLMASSNSLATVFISLELASLPSYALVAVLKKNRGSVEAGLKYFLIGALSSAIFAYGISLVYGVTGHLQLNAIATSLGNGFSGMNGVLGVGVLMVVAGVGFKTASVPFHFWAPEAYEGAPAPISGFLSSASKAAGFVVAFRVFVTAFPFAAVSGTVDWVLAFQILAVLTMTLGNFAAATQDKVKRMLAYSSVGQAGYVLIGLAALYGGNNDGVLSGAMLQLFVYGFMNTGAFLFIALAEQWGIGKTFEDYNGLAEKAPMACLAMTVFLYNLAGLPLGAGFLSKYFLFGAAVGAGFWWLTAIAAINSALSVFFYTRVVKAMWIEDPDDEFTIRSTPTGLYVAILAAAVITVVLLFAFGPLHQVAHNAAVTLFA